MCRHVCFYENPASITQQGDAVCLSLVATLTVSSMQPTPARLLSSKSFHDFRIRDGLLLLRAVRAVSLSASLEAERRITLMTVADWPREEGDKLWKSICILCPPVFGRKRLKDCGPLLRKGLLRECSVPIKVAFGEHAAATAREGLPHFQTR